MISGCCHKHPSTPHPLLPPSLSWPLSITIQQLKTWPKGDPRTLNCNCNQCPCLGSVLNTLNITLVHLCRQLLVVTSLCSVCPLTVSVWRDNLTDSYSLRNTHINDLSLSRSPLGEQLVNCSACVHQGPFLSIYMIHQELPSALDFCRAAAGVEGAESLLGPRHWASLWPPQAIFLLWDRVF